MLKCPHVLQPLWVSHSPMDLLTDLVFGCLDGAAVAMDQLPARTTQSPDDGQKERVDPTSSRSQWGWVRTGNCWCDGFPSVQPCAEIPSDRAASTHGGLAQPIPLNGAGTREEKGMGGQGSQHSSHHFCCLGETSCQAGKRTFYRFLCTCLVAWLHGPAGPPGS